MARALRALRWLTALATMLLIALLCWQAVVLFLTESYSREAASARLAALSPAFWGYGALVCISLLCHAIAGQKEPSDASRRAVRMEERRQNPPVHLLRMALYALAFIMIVWGVMNGGLRDVLVKAIQICTECIGLG